MSRAWKQYCNLQLTHKSNRISSNEFKAASISRNFATILMKNNTFFNKQQKCYESIKFNHQEQYEMCIWTSRTIEFLEKSKVMRIEQTKHDSYKIW